MKKLLGIALGIITSIGGFLDVGAALRTLCVNGLVEPAGQPAAAATSAAIAPPH